MEQEEQYLIPTPDYDVARAALARKRKIAAELLQTSLNKGVHAGNMFAMSGADPGAFLSRAAGRIDSDRLDAEDKLLGQQETGQRREFLARNGIDPDTPKDLRASIAAQLAWNQQQPERAAEAERNRIEKGEQSAADRVDRAEQKELDRQARQELRQTPTINISQGGGRGAAGGIKAPSGYRYNEDGTGLEPIPGGPADPAVKGEKPLTDAQAKDVVYGTRAAQAQNILDEVGTSFSPMKLDIARGAERIPGGRSLANTALLGENEQKIDQAQRNFINAVLRRESGAVIADTEFANARKQYFPEQGDSDAVLKQKRANRELVISGLATGAGKAGAKEVEKERANKPEPTKPKPTVVREVKLKDGRTGVEYSDGTRGFK